MKSEHRRQRVPARQRLDADQHQQHDPGRGHIGDSGALAIVNKATIDANSKGQSLNLNEANGGVTNTGTLEATAGGVLQLFNTITNTGGAITASGTARP